MGEGACGGDPGRGGRGGPELSRSVRLGAGRFGSGRGALSFGGRFLRGGLGPPRDGLPPPGFLDSAIPNPQIPSCEPCQTQSANRWTKH